MTTEEESHVLLQTGCPQPFVQALLSFAEKYRAGMTSDAVQKNRKLGTRALVRLANRLAKYSHEQDLRSLLSQAILSEFLPAAEALTLNSIFESCGIKKVTPPVCLRLHDWLSDFNTKSAFFSVLSLTDSSG